VGSCIGIRGNRIQSIVNELQGEKIDVVPWDNDSKVFIAKALSPSEVVHVELNPIAQTATVVVPDRQLSLAIGKEGQNARLASRLSGWRLDIKGLTEWDEIKENRERERNEARLLAAQQRAEGLTREAELAISEAEAIIESATAPEVEVAEPVASVEKAITEQPEDQPSVKVIAEVEAPPADVLTEEALLAALIEEENAAMALSPAGEGTPGLSVDELESFTLEDVVDEDEEDYQDEDREVAMLVPEASILTPDAGKIRFAEDIVGDHRGGTGRRARGARRSGAGAARGGARRGPARGPGPGR
jgi:transcription antitermination factor NusA-like protein